MPNGSPCRFVTSVNQISMPHEHSVNIDCFKARMLCAGFRTERDCDMVVFDKLHTLRESQKSQHRHSTILNNHVGGVRSQLFSEPVHQALWIRRTHHCVAQAENRNGLIAENRHPTEALYLSARIELKGFARRHRIDGSGAKDQLDPLTVRIRNHNTVAPAWERTGLNGCIESGGQFF